MNHSSNQGILEPFKFYHDILKDDCLEYLNAYFDDLVNQSEIDVEENHRLSQQLEDLQKIKTKTNKQLDLRKFIRTLLWRIVVIVFVVPLFLSIIEYPVSESFVIICFMIIVVAATINFAFLNKLVDKAEKEQDKLDQQITDAKEQLERNITPLLTLFRSDMTHEIIRKVFPMVDLDLNFNMERFEEMVFDYDFPQSLPHNCSAMNVITGDIVGNPFIIMEEISEEQSTCTYSGRRSVSYSRPYIDMDGKRRSRTVYQTLYAELTKFKPTYSLNITLTYLSNAAPDLSFSRWPQTGLTHSDLVKNVRSESKLALKTGGNFQPMTNEEFEALFAALDRDDEQEFRLLFTPLAQENMVDLIKNGPEGDEFLFTKEKKSNIIQWGANKEWDLDTSPKHYYDLDLEKVREKFIDRNFDYFNKFYLNLLPILSIPLYQQHKPKEYVYKDIFNDNFNPYLVETLAYKIHQKDQRHFAMESIASYNAHIIILKAMYINSFDSYDLFKILSSTYKPVKRVDHVPVMAGNGVYYKVPVEWIEFVPVGKEVYIQVANLDKRYHEAKYINALEEFSSSVEGRAMGFVHSDYLVAVVQKGDINITDLVDKICQEV